MANENDAFAGQPSSSNQNPTSDAEYLRRISEQLERLIRETRRSSQSSASDSERGRTFNDLYRDYTNRADRRRPQSTFRGGRRWNNDEFLDSIEEGLLEGFLGDDYKKRISKSLNDFADAFGLDLENLETQLGKELGKQALNSLRNSKLGQSLLSSLRHSGGSIFNNVSARFRSGVANYDREHGTSYASRFDDVVNRARRSASDAFDNSEASAEGASPGADASQSANAAQSAASAAETASQTEGMASAATEASEGLAALSTSSANAAAASEGASAALAGLGSIAPHFLAAVAAVTLVTAALRYSFAPAIESGKKLLEQLRRAGLRYKDSRDEQLKAQEKRMREDLETVIRAPFEILEKAANEAYDVWDNYVRKINGTQGYNKEDLASLMGAYAQRLRDEGLSNVVSSTDITRSLAQVLESGLSGKIAEEFAYQASKLNAAVPTQDFFSYAGTYASIAANAIKSGMSQAQAIEYANQQIYTFASNVLYASRNLAGGFTTGLRDAQTLFEQSVKIAQAGKTNNAAGISSVMTAVAAIVGAIAPDLSSSITDIVYKAAVGGNASDIVALRSLANINASNSEFLKKLATDPQSIFAELFNNLGKMQTMSQSAWMEVAEGLADVFGVPMEALARVDFNYLAQAIANMNVNNTALMDNIDLLAKGQTTTTAEQMKIAQINKYMIEEGLAYVLDNEAARAIQQHMWEEQIANSLMEAEYSVNLHGAALQFLQGLRKTVDSILNFLNPLGFLFKAVKGIFDSVSEYHAQEADLRQILELGKVGQGNVSALYQLTTRGTNLKLVKPLADLMGGFSSYAAISSANAASRDALSLLTNPGLGLVSVGGNFWGTPDLFSNMSDSIVASVERGFQINSKYQWGTLSKSAARSLTSATAPTVLSAMMTNQELQSAKDESNTQALISKFNQLIDPDYIRGFAEDSSKNYDDWISTASKFGISDIDKALEAVGKNEEDMKGIFQDMKTEAASNEKKRREEKEEALWDATFAHQPQLETLISTNNELTIGTNTLLTTTNQLITATNLKLSEILVKEKAFYDDWVAYYITRWQESSIRGYSYSKVQEIQRREKDEKDTAIYALAEMLSSNKLDLHDPVVQTNALLSQILLVVNAIQQKNNESGPTSLLGSISALALGLQQPTT